MELDLDWCLTCFRKTKNGSSYCNDQCRRNDLVPSPINTLPFASSPPRTSPAALSPSLPCSYDDPPLFPSNSYSQPSSAFPQPLSVKTITPPSSLQNYGFPAYYSRRPSYSRAIYCRRGDERRPSPPSSSGSSSSSEGKKLHQYT
ncbi:uncharacterized protein VTP21DRAFT_3688 [Calcarisporiella thermophila]|uniref:uncharacterized protein n=1 Tax=Calcarisporiella thermophila TaxID=911321 RepID=UPI0037437E99